MPLDGAIIDPVERPPLVVALSNFSWQTIKQKPKGAEQQQVEKEEEQEEKEGEEEGGAEEVRVASRFGFMQSERRK